ncbi:NADH-cytochrome b5 reductase 1 [Artemisia annua]|uniref:cytochrome-b5 reductase n=1 Tax=Artemisia annua TaxID=35608 RepID=A0A2U1N6G3_ARTAN|nr:NADH-cytochrome b5 reductase 1 [Artemisia annua]
MDFLEANETQIVIAGFAIAIAAFYLINSRKPKGCLDPEKFRDFKLVKRTQLSHNVAKFKFALPTPTSVFGLAIGQHISCRGKDSQGEEVIKPYTPTTVDTDLGYFELVIKMYPQGRMSHHFREMKEGDYLSVKGPKGRFKYRFGDVRAYGMLAGGSGITPMFQPPERWTGGVGFVTKEMIKEHLPEPAFDIKILRCGPPPMNKAMAGHLEALGYDPETLFQF